MLATSNQLPEVGFVKLPQIIGNRKANPPITAVLPVGRTTFLNGVKSGKYPKPVKHGRSSLWRVEDIRALIESISAQNQQA
jgi:prophage regulatory protein